MNHVLEPILNMHGVVVYLLVAALVFGEAAFFIGFILPGETAVVLGGVLAHRGQVSLSVLLVVVAASAIAGDSVGYEVGKVAGPRLLRSKFLRKRHRQIDGARLFLRRYGGWAVVLGRFTAFLRAVTPALAGTAGLPYRRFLPFNAIGGVLWGTAFTLVGYLAGASYERVEKLIGRGALVVAALVVTAVIVAAIILHRRREKSLEEAGEREEDREAELPSA